MPEAPTEAALSPEASAQVEAVPEAYVWTPELYRAFDALYPKGWKFPGVDVLQQLHQALNLSVIPAAPPSPAPVSEEAWPDGFFIMEPRTRLYECATEGCGQRTGIRIERDGIGSNYCEPCARKIAALTSPADLPAPPAIGESVTEAIRDKVEELAGLAREFDMLGADRIAREIDAYLTAALAAKPGWRETERKLIEELWGALNFILAFYEPGQTYLDTNAWKQAEASGRRAHKAAREYLDALPAAPAGGE